jgi:hypothetical protein
MSIIPPNNNLCLRLEEAEAEIEAEAEVEVEVQTEIDIRETEIKEPVNIIHNKLYLTIIYGSQNKF